MILGLTSTELLKSPTAKESHAYSAVMFGSGHSLNAPETTQWSVSEGWGKLGTWAIAGGQVCPSHCPTLSFLIFNLLSPRAPWFCSEKHLNRRFFPPVQGWTQSLLSFGKTKTAIGCIVDVQGSLDVGTVEMTIRIQQNRAWVRSFTMFWGCQIWCENRQEGRHAHLFCL